MKLVSPVAAAAPSLDEAIGTVAPPPGVQGYIAQATTADPTATNALLFFLSNLIKIMTLVLGMWVILNLIMAAYAYFTSAGDPKAHETVRQKIVMSAVGLLLIVVAYVLVGMVSLLLFGDAGFVLSPEF